MVPLIIPNEVRPSSDASDFRVRFEREEPGETGWQRTLHQGLHLLWLNLWASRYAAVLVTGLLAIASTCIGTAITPYTAPLFLKFEAADSTSQNKTTFGQRELQTEVADRIHHAVIERDFTLQEEIPGTLLGLLGLALADLVNKVLKKRK